jgi:hypothetical protein
VLFSRPLAQFSKSFLLLFFKKEALPFFHYEAATALLAMTPIRWAR